jgi:hypothetical protein
LLLNSFITFIVELRQAVAIQTKFFKMKMLNYVKKILTRVSFDARLFEKELRKAIKMLVANEVQELRNWCYANYGLQYGAILNRCFIVA